MTRILVRLALVAWGAAGCLAAPPQGSTQEWVEVQFQGGSVDDRVFARAAFGRHAVATFDQAAFARGFAALVATDRFRTVENPPGALHAGTVALRLDPWPALRGWSWEGDPVPVRVRRRLFPELSKGVRLGSLRLESWRQAAQQRIRQEGHPQATLQVRREAGDTRLVFEVRLGPPALVHRVRIVGELTPYGEARLLEWSGLRPGRTLWTDAVRQRTLAQLRRHFLKAGRYQAQVSAAWDPTEGSLSLTVNPGPVVELRAEGEGLGWTSLRDLVPLARSERYGPELLDEGERRILRHLRERGYLDAKVTHLQQVLAGSPERPERVRVTYRLESGTRIRLGAVRFERNRELGDSDLKAATPLPHRWIWFGAPLGTPDLLDELEERLTWHYLVKGFPDVALRKRLEPLGDRHALVFQVREGAQVLLHSVVLSLPSGVGWEDPRLGEALLGMLGEDPRREQGPEAGSGTWLSERPELAGVRATLARREAEGGEGPRHVLTFSRPVPFVKSDLARCLTVLRARAQGLGIRRPLEQVRLEERDPGGELTIRLQSVPRTLFQGLTVQGADATRAEAVMRTFAISAGGPYDPARLREGQARLGSLNAFQRVDILTPEEAGLPKPEGGWGDGDLVLRLEERPPWVFHSGFGYDKSLGYHVAFGVQRLNFQGMGRTLDLGFRAGDATLKIPALEKAFPTGEFARSVDSYALGYSDPLFPTGWAPSWLPDRAQYRMEASYIQEQKTSYLIRRRRVVNDLEWRPVPLQGFHLGHRYERSESRYVDLIDFNAPRYAGFKPFEHIFYDEGSLNRATKSPARAVVSAPYVQWYRDSRDSRIDPTAGSFTHARLEFANQLFGTSANTSFVRLDLRQQWTWPVGYRARAGVLSLGLRVGVVSPTTSYDRNLPEAERLNLPLAERYFAGGPGTHRGVEPDALGPRSSIPSLRRNDEGLYQPVLVNWEGGQSVLYDVIPTGGQGLALLNLEYRFPLIGQTVWGEVFVDSGQVYDRVREATRGLDGSPPFPPLRTSLGLGLIFKVGLPIKLEYGADWKRILGRPRTQAERDTQLKSLLISAGFTF